MRKVVCLYGILFMVCVLPSYIQAVSFSADGVVANIPDGFQFPAADEDNIIFPCGVVKNGFALEDATTTCSFQSLFSVSGDVDLNGGTLILQSDLYFDNKSSTLTAGRIIGNGNTLGLSPRTSVLNQSTDEMTMCDTEIFLSADVTLHGTWRFAGNTNVLNGQGYTVTLDDDATLIIDQGLGLVLENVNIVGLGAGKLYCTTDETELTLHNTTLVMSSDYSFTQGHLKVIENCHLQGAYTFAYESVVSSTLASQAKLYVDAGATFKYNPVSRDKTLLVFEDSSSRMCLTDGRLYAGTGGMLLTKGSLHVEGLSYLRSDSWVQAEYIPYTIYMVEGLLELMATYTGTEEIEDILEVFPDLDLTSTVAVELTSLKMNVINNGITLGTGQSADDFKCCIKQGSTLCVEQDTVLSYSNSNRYLMKSTGGYALLQIGAGAALDIYTPLSTTDVFIAFEKGACLGKCDAACISAPITFKDAFLRKKLP